MTTKAPAEAHCEGALTHGHGPPSAVQSPLEIHANSLKFPDNRQISPNTYRYAGAA
jgi:hypothetical protein